MRIPTTFVLAMLGLALFWTSAAQAQMQHKATILNIEGVVDVQRGGSGAWVAATEGMELVAGDKIRTTIGSVADLRMKGASSVRVQEETEVILEQMEEKETQARFLYFLKKPVQADQAKLTLTEGRVLSRVRHLTNSQSTFRVTTPKGVAGVRGTSWFVGTEDLGVQQGHIDWNGNEEDPGGDPFDALANFVGGGQQQEAPGTRINEGMEARIDEGGELVDIEVFSEERIGEMRDFQQAVFEKVKEKVQERKEAKKLAPAAAVDTAAADEEEADELAVEEDEATGGEVVPDNQQTAVDIVADEEEEQTTENTESNEAAAEESGAKQTLQDETPAPVAEKKQESSP